MKTEFKTRFKTRYVAAAKRAAIGFIAILAVTASATMTHVYTAPAPQMETITVTAKRIRTERMATIIVSAPRLANTWVASAPITSASNAARL